MRKKLWIFAAFAACAWGSSVAQQGGQMTESEFRGVLAGCLQQISEGPGRSRERRDLLELAACLQENAQPPDTSVPVLTNDDIVALTDNGVPAFEIISTIRQQPNNFDTSVAALVRLARAGVDATVIEAMDEAGASGRAQAPATQEPFARQEPFPRQEPLDRQPAPLRDPNPLSSNVQRSVEQLIGYGRRIRDGAGGVQSFADSLRSGGRGPEMVLIPAGVFEMGCISGGCRSDERPAHTVQISRPFAIGRFEVTFAQWDACAAAGGCGMQRPGDQGWGRGNRPVINVSLQDAEAYVQWLSRETGERYRLPSEAEWEYAARAGSRTRYPWGNEMLRNMANCSDCGSRWGDNQTAPVGSFPPNDFGLHDMHGNVWERLADCWNGSYSRAPNDGSAWRRGNCSRNVLRGGSWTNAGKDLRSANRNENTADTRSDSLGFRVARDVSQ